MHKKWLARLFLLLLAISVAAATLPATAYGQGKAAKPPGILIVSPREGATLQVSEPPIKLKVANFKLDAKSIGGANRPGAGHISLVVDGVSLARIAKDSFKLGGLAPGQHTLLVSLSNNDRSPLSPPTDAQTSFTYQLPAKPSKASKDAIRVVAPAPTPTPAFERKRSDVARYLTAYNKIVNDLEAAVNALGEPNISDLLAFNRFVDQALVAVKGGQSRLQELQSASTEPQTAAHLSQTRALVDEFVASLSNLKAAISSGDQAKLTSSVNSVQSIEAKGSAVNRATEALLSAYNIPDADVDYKSRGE